LSRLEAKIVAAGYLAEQEKRLGLAPDETAFDQEEVRALLIAEKGNVTKAAMRIAVEPERLRSYVNAIPALRRAMAEIMEQRVDRAAEALDDEGSFQNRFYAAKEILRSDAGRRRGFGREPPALEIRNESASAAPIITLKWLEPKEEG
jgi:hypothetical protein